MVGERRCLHHAPDQVVGDKMHADLPLDHGRGKAAQDVHLQEGFKLPKMQPDAPSAEVEEGELGRCNARVQNGGDQGDGEGSKAPSGVGVSDDPHGDAGGQ